MTKNILIFVLGIITLILFVLGGYLFTKYKYTKTTVEQAKFEVKLPLGDENYKQTGITSQNIKKVKIVNTDSTKGLEIQLDDEGKKIFEKITSDNIGKQVGLFIDDVIISLPTIQETIQGGQLMITHDFTNNDLLNLKARLLGYYYPNSREYQNLELTSPQEQINN